VLGCAAGTAEVRFGGPQGPALTLRAHDAVLIPAGVAHKCERASADFRVVGSYPRGCEWDMQYGGEEGAAERAAGVAVPEADPLVGADGGVCEHWRAAAARSGKAAVRGAQPLQRQEQAHA
jgi:uncharacterized protein YjlB